MAQRFFSGRECRVFRAQSLVELCGPTTRTWPHLRSVKARLSLSFCTLRCEITVARDLGQLVLVAAACAVPAIVAWWTTPLQAGMRAASLGVFCVGLMACEPWLCARAVRAPVRHWGRGIAIVLAATLVTFLSSGQ